jgi:hypothetical protein
MPLNAGAASILAASLAFALTNLLKRAIQPDLERSIAAALAAEPA